MVTPDERIEILEFVEGRVRDLRKRLETLGLTILNLFAAADSEGEERTEKIGHARREPHRQPYLYAGTDR